jgi:2-oxoisovalerate dehydrogenase E2 component (dihydrolipoyl transacylase)
VPGEKSAVAGKREDTAAGAAPVEKFVMKARDPGAPIMTSPAVRVLAKKERVDLALVPSSRKDGRITKEDLINFLSGKIAPLLATPSAPTPAVAQPAAVPQPFHIANVSTQDKVIKVNSQQRGMTKAMTEALKIPHLTYSDEVFLDELIKVKKALAKAGTKITFMPFFMKALSIAMLDYPVVNSQFGEDLKTYTQFAGHNISIAMDTPHGLFVPNVKNCEQKSVLQIAEDMRQLSEVGNAGKFSDELDGGTISLSNVGMIGGTYLRPVILPPQVMIGGLGAIKPQLAKIQGTIEER